MAQSFWRLGHVELGFTTEGAVTFLLPVPGGVYPDHEAATRLHDDVLGRLRALPGVEAAEAATIAAFPLEPVPDYYMDRIAVGGNSPDSVDSPYVLFSFATPGYFRAMGIPLLAGRAFEGADADPEAQGVILSAALARTLFGGEDPIGREVRLRTTARYALRVVGVAGDVPSRAIADGPSMVAYLPNLYRPLGESAAGAVQLYTPRSEVYVVRTSLPPLSLVRAIRRSIDEVDPKLVMARIGTLEDLVAGAMARPRVTMLLLLVSAGTALVLGLVGIYGILAYAVRQRGLELGLRLALGASPEGVVWMVVREGAVLATLGIIAGLAAALALTRLLGGLLYEVSPMDPGTFAGMTALLFAVALLASYVPAWRAGRIDPVRALKGE
jgi:predicted permease